MYYVCYILCEINVNDKSFDKSMYAKYMYNFESVSRATLPYEEGICMVYHYVVP